MEQCYCIKFCQKLGDCQVETIRKIQTDFPVATMEAFHGTKTREARQVHSNVKVMLTAFVYFRGVIHHEYAPQGQTITKEYYRDVLRRLRDAVGRKRPELWSTCNWRLHKRQCFSTFLALDLDIFGEKPDSCGSPGSLLSLRLLPVPQTQEAIEMSDKFLADLVYCIPRLRWEKYHL